MKRSLIEFGTLLTVIGLMFGAYSWDSGRRDKQIMTEMEHIDEELHAGNVDLDLRLVEAELKHLRDTEERRPLTPDEQDRKRYLETRRQLLMEEQRRKSDA